MRCSYCEQSVLGFSPITVPGIGPAHIGCYQTQLISERIFSGLNIAKLDDVELNELADLVSMEKNSRASMSDDHMGELDIELF